MIPTRTPSLDASLRRLRHAMAEGKPVTLTKYEATAMADYVKELEARLALPEIVKTQGASAETAVLRQRAMDARDRAVNLGPALVSRPATKLPLVTE